MKIFYLWIYDGWDLTPKRTFAERKDPFDFRYLGEFVAENIDLAIEEAKTHHELKKINWHWKGIEDGGYSLIKGETISILILVLLWLIRK